MTLRLQTSFKYEKISVISHSFDKGLRSIHQYQTSISATILFLISWLGFDSLFFMVIESRHSCLLDLGTEKVREG